MNLNEISIWVGKVFDGLYIGWPYKTALGIVFLALERHLELFTAFACIVCVDLFAKFIALSYGYLAQSMTGNAIHPCNDFPHCIKSVDEHLKRMQNP